jgi:small subunit ribosomal protein S1
MDMSVVKKLDDAMEMKQKMQFVGKVVKIGLAGAVIDIGTGSPAAIHVSHIINTSDEPIKRVEDVLEVGQEIDVWVRKVKGERIELTMIKPLDLEWREIKKGMALKGSVVRLEKFGAFVEIGAERPGLIHISEMAHGYVRTPSEVVKEGEDVDVEVLEVNRKKKQIKLSMKALQPLPEELEDRSEYAKLGSDDQPRDKSGRRKKGGSKKSGEMSAEGGQKSDEEKAADTAMGAALREAMDRAKSQEDSQADKNRKKQPASQEQEDIISRTLEQRAP